MEDQEGKYNVKAASLMLGIQPGTLRAWERRYKMIQPSRNESGHRLYTEEHIQVLRLLIKKVNQGFTISQAISLLGNDSLQNKMGINNRLQTNQESILTDRLLDALFQFNTSKAAEMVDRLFSFFSTEKVLFDVFSSLSERINDSFKSGEIILAQKNFATTYLITRIRLLIHTMPNLHHLKAVMIQSTEEDLTIKELILTFMLRSRGVDVINVGSNVDDAGITKVLDLIAPELLIITVHKLENLPKVETLIKHLTLTNKNLKLGIAGDVLHSIEQSQLGSIADSIIGEKPIEWENWLIERMSL